MNNVSIYKNNNTLPSAKIRRLGIKRDWMDEKVYGCHPMAFANTIGYGIYYEEDISFIWNGQKESAATAILGKDYIWSGRGEGTVSFLTNFVIKTDDNLSILTTPVPNQFNIQDATCITSLLSTSFLTIDFPIVWKIHVPNKEILIPSGTDIACIIPISIGQIQDTNIEMYDTVYPIEPIQTKKEYTDKIKDNDGRRAPVGMYKKAIDHHGNSIGKHEVDNLKMTIKFLKGKDLL